MEVGANQGLECLEMLLISFPGGWERSYSQQAKEEWKRAHNLSESGGHWAGNSRSNNYWADPLGMRRQVFSQEEGPCSQRTPFCCKHRKLSSADQGSSPEEGRGQTHWGICNLLQSLVWPNSKDDFAVRRDGDAVVAAGLEHAFCLSLSCGQTPFVHSTICATGNQLAVICIPRNWTNLQGMKTCPAGSVHVHSLSLCLSHTHTPLKERRRPPYVIHYAEAECPFLVHTLQ